MTRRLYFILPDVDTSRKVEEQLLLARIEEKRMHFLGKRGTDMKDLPEATHLQKTDLMRGTYVGLFAGAITGMLAGLYIYFTPETVGMQVQPYVIFVCGVAGAILGAFISGPLIGGSTPNAKLQQYKDSLQEGNILLIIDVPSKRVDEVRKIIKQAYPGAKDHGADPTMPAFP